MELIKIQESEKGLRTDSITVADVFGKKHYNVLRDIELLQCSQEFSNLNFEATSYKDSQNREKPMFNMTRNGWSMLVMGFTGEKAMVFKEAYIEAFDKMETQLKSQPKLPTSIELAEQYIVAEKARLLLLEQNNLLEAKNTELTPKAQFHDDVSVSEGEFSISDIAKQISVKPNQLREMLRGDKVLRKDNTPIQEYVNNGYFTLRLVSNNNYYGPQTFVTCRGLTFIHRKYATKQQSF